MINIRTKSSFSATILLRAKKRGGEACFSDNGCEEDTLIQGTLSGDKEAFEKLMKIHLKVIYNYISAHVSENENVKDIVQEAMLSIWKGLNKFNRNSSFRTWCIGITKRKIADYYRISYKNMSISLSEIEDELISETGLHNVETKLAVEKSIEFLGKTEKEILFLVFNAQLSYAEISQIVGIPIGTIKSKMSSIKSKLKTQLESGGGV